MPVDLKARVLLRDTLGGSVRIPKWLSRSHAIFCESLLDRTYPCHLGTAAEKQGELLITYIEGDDREHLPSTLSTFLGISAAHPDQRFMLALFFEPENELKSLEHYKVNFWELLQFLHDRDPRPWPEEQPVDSCDPRWEFTFDETPMFVFEATPAYRQRRSRNLGPGVVVLFQPRRVFAGMEGGTPAGIKTRKVIRKRQSAWDGMGPHPDMGSYGDLSNSEWKQYFLSDDNTPVVGQCPLRRKTAARLPGGG